MPQGILTQVASLMGAVLILSAYLGLHTGYLRERSTLYLNLNLAGAVLLFFAAVAARQWGFMILEGAWIGITLYGFSRAS